MKKLPLKTRILQYALEKDGEFTLDEVYHALEPEYRGERIFTPRHVKDYFESFIGVGFFTTAHMDFDENGELVYSCKVTKDAMARKKYFH